MNGGKVLLDTNAVLYLLGGKLETSALPAGKFFISFITELELLSYPLLTQSDERVIKEFLKEMNQSPEAVESFSVKKKDLGEKGKTKLVILKA